MNTPMYESAAREERLKESFARSKGGKLDEWAVMNEAYNNDAPQQVIAETEMIWTMVNQ